MAMRFIRKVRTASGAVAVPIVNRTGRTDTGIEHIGSAHNDAELGILLAQAEERLRPGQQAFDLGGLEKAAVRTTDVANWHETALDQKQQIKRSRSSVPQVMSSPLLRRYFATCWTPLVSDVGSTSLLTRRSRPWFWPD